MVQQFVVHSGYTGCLHANDKSRYNNNSFLLPLPSVRLADLAAVPGVKQTKKLSYRLPLR